MLLMCDFICNFGNFGNFNCLLGGQPETHQASWSLSKASKHGIKNLLFPFFFCNDLNCLYKVLL